MTTTGDQLQSGTGQGAPPGVTPAGEPGAAGSAAPAISNEVLDAIRTSQREMMQGIQRDINALKSGVDRNMHQLRQTFEERLATVAAAPTRDIAAMLESPHIDEAEKTRLRGELTQRQVDTEREARLKAEHEAAYNKEMLEGMLIVNNALAAWGMTGQEEGLYQPQPGESPRDAAVRVIASIPQAKLNTQRAAAQAAAARPATQPARTTVTPGAPRLDVSTPSGPVPADEALQRWTAMSLEEREAVMKRIRKAGAASRPIGVREAVMGS